MKTHISFWMALTLLASVSAQASDDVIMISEESDAIAQFDRVLSEQRKQIDSTKKSASNAVVGQRIAAEAKKIGESVKSNQYRNSSKNMASAQRNNNSSGGASASDRSSNSGRGGGAGNGNSNSNRPGKGSGPKKDHKSFGSH